MANELAHGTVGVGMTQAEFEAVGLHVLNSQATGDIIYASSATQLSRLGIGSANKILQVIDGLPSWQLAPGAGHITILLPFYDSIGAGSWAITHSTTYFLNHQVSSGTNLDNISYKVFLAAGTYSVGMIATKDSDAGISDIDIDGVEIASFDWYNASFLANQQVTDTGNVIATSGLKTLRIRIDGQNASASGYVLRLSALALWRTA